MIALKPKTNYFTIRAFLLFAFLLGSFGDAFGDRVRRGFAGGGSGSSHSGGYSKPSPSVALGTYGSHLDNPHPQYRKQTVQESLGSYGGFTNNRHGYGGKQTVQEALGSYGSFLNNPHAGYRKQTVQESLGAYGSFLGGSSYH